MMEMGSPFKALHAAMAAAVYRDFPEITYVDRDWTAWRNMSKEDQILSIKNDTVPKIKKTRRVYDYEVEVVMFPQTWGSTALGYGGIGGSAMTTAYTVVVSYNGYYCVYFGSSGRLAYTVDRIRNGSDGCQRFIEDMYQQNVADCHDVVRYK
jgi:hypothetical protein